MATRKRVFGAVFPSSANATIPTPSSTPVLQSSSFKGNSVSPGGGPVYEHPAAAEQWERVWHNITTFLSLPNKPITIADLSHGEEAFRSKWLSKSCPQDMARSIEYLIQEHSRAMPSILGTHQDDLGEWYAHEIDRHFVDVQLPPILKMLRDCGDIHTLRIVFALLQAAQRVYIHPFKLHILPMLPGDHRYELAKFIERHHALVSKTFSLNGFADHLRDFLKRVASIILELNTSKYLLDKNAMEEDPSTDVAEERQITFEMLYSICDVGLGGAQAQRIFAEIMSELLTTHINSTYAGRWASPSTVTKELRNWVENHFARFAVEVLEALSGKPRSSIIRVTQVALADVTSWQERAISDLGALRLKELFDVIVNWSDDTKGAIEDLKQCIKAPSARHHFTSAFSAVISTRLLQPGASTTEILQVYICIIKAFAILESKGVLLDRLAKPIRRYLRERDDTIKIIVGGLLADASDTQENGDNLAELAIELNKISKPSAMDDGSGELDWDDMGWVPDPVDAGPDYKKSKNSDVIGTLISIFDTKDIFVKEFQNIMGERLLRKDFDYDKEIRVLELLKLRFGEAALQACEVMLRDVDDSRRVEFTIKKDMENNPLTAPEFHTKILSRLFWPTLHAESFHLPPPIQELQALYSTGFEALKQSRKLTWLPALGQVTVELQLNDRIVTEEVHTWQASVIYAFQGHTNSDEPVTKTVEELIEGLDMDEPLVMNALTYWVSKLVLREVAPSVYSVIEDLADTEMNSKETNEAAMVAAAANAVSSTNATIRSDEEVVMEKMSVAWQFIMGMLTNQGAMPLNKIVMMLNIVLPGGFQHGADELKDFLGKQVNEGRLELAGGKYKMVR